MMRSRQGDTESATSKAITAIGRELGLLKPDEKIVVQRVRAGRHQRAAGAWSWSANMPEGRERFGSVWSARDVIAAHRKKLVVVYRPAYDPSGASTELLIEKTPEDAARAKKQTQ